MNIDEMIEVMQAYKNGKEIEMFDATQGKWIDVKNPLWNFFQCVYRIKKKPTRLEVANELWEKTFGISGKFDNHICPANDCKFCPIKEKKDCYEALKNWWKEEYKGGAENE